MADTTARYGFPFQEATDPPDGAGLGQDLAESVEAALSDLEDRGYLFLQQVRFTASGAFIKASYPDARLARIRVQGGGGGGGGAQANAAGNNAAAGGGQGGGYAESLVAVSGMVASVTVTVGAGGTAGGTTGSGSAGTGGTSSFGSTVVAGGGAGGTNGGTSTTWFFIVGGSSVQTLTGDITAGGQDGGPGIRNGTAYVSGQQCGGTGGSSQMGGGGRGSANAQGVAGRNYGGGGGGSSTAASAAAIAGTAGAPGIVIVDLYA